MSLVNWRSSLVVSAAVAAILVPVKLLTSTSSDPSPVQARQFNPTAVPEIRDSVLAYAYAAPLFDTDRNPQTAESPAPAPSDPQATPASPPPPVLVGLVTRGAGRGVVLTRTNKGETVMLAPGENADGWSLVRFNREEAVFELDGKRHTARLDFSNKNASAPSAPGPADGPTVSPSGSLPPAPPASLPQSDRTSS